MGYIVNGGGGGVDEIVGSEGEGKQLSDNGEGGGGGDQLLKFKKRKVSANRDFPPRCGRQCGRADFKFKENGVAGNLVGSSICEGEGEGEGEGALVVRDGSDKELDRLVEMITSDVADGVVQKELPRSPKLAVTETDGMQLEDLGPKSPPELMDNLENVVVDAVVGESVQPEVTDNVQSQCLLEKTMEVEENDRVQLSVSVDVLGRSSQKRCYPPRPEKSAIRDFPPGCGIGAAPVDLEEFRKSVDSSKGKSLGGERSNGGVEKERMVKANAGDVLKGKMKEKTEVGDGVQVTPVGGVNKNTVQRVHAKEASKVKLKQGNAEKSSTKSPDENSATQSDSSTKKVERGGGGSGGKFGTESLKLSKDVTFKRKFPGKFIANKIDAIIPYQGKQNVGSDSSNEPVIVQSLMAKSNCPWTHGRTISKPATGTQSKVEPAKKTPKSASAVQSQVEQVKKTPKSANDIHSRVEQGNSTIKSGSGSQSQSAVRGGLGSSGDREIVAVLMAAPYCPWRNSKKKAFVSPSGQAKKFLK